MVLQALMWARRLQRMRGDVWPARLTYKLPPWGWGYLCKYTNFNGHSTLNQAPHLDKDAIMTRSWQIMAA